jgi:DNA repair protein RecO
VTRSPLAGAAGDGLSHVGYFAELLDEWAPEAAPNEKLYRLGAAVAEALGGGAPVDRLARYFEYWLLRLEGLYPSVVSCPGCAADLTAQGAVVATRDRVFLCRQCARAAGPTAGSLSPEALAFLRGAGRRRPAGLEALPLSARAARELEMAHQALIAAHLEKELRSSRVLRELK